VREVREAARSLKRFAERGRHVPEFDHPRIRELLVRNFRLIYQHEGDVVYVLALIHGTRDLWAAWDEKQRKRS
jgi:toxin ParE1/3/4